MTKTEKQELRDIVTLNKASFESDDWYSTVGAVLSLIHMEDGKIFTVKKEGTVVAYLLLKFDGGAYHCARRGVAQSAKRQGLGTKLTKRAVKYAHEQGFNYRTYMAVDNIASVNSNIKAGLRVVNIGTEWVKMVSKY